jgi:hypothetical protein
METLYRRKDLCCKSVFVHACVRANVWARDGLLTELVLYTATTTTIAMSKPIVRHEIVLPSL